MPEKTGKSLKEWLALLSEKPFNKHSEAVNFLKKEHGVTHGFANTIVHLSKADEQPAEDGLLAAQYLGKENLKPIYDKLIAEIGRLGTDVELAPKKAYVSIRRKKQFALIQPSTKARLDIGINLKGKEPEGKLEASGSFNTMCSHRVKVVTLEEVDECLLQWLKEAYEQAG